MPRLSQGQYRLGSHVVRICGALRDPSIDVVGLERFATTDASDVVLNIRGVERLGEPGAGWELRYCTVDGDDVVRVDCTEWSAIFDLRGRTVDAELSSTRRLALDSLLKTVLQLIALHDRSGLVVHASAVERGGEAFVFCGRSGAGKTTAAFLSCNAGAKVIAEEMVFVGGLDRDIAPEVLTLPFWQKDGTMTVPERLPLRRIFALKQAPLDAVEAMTHGAQVRALLSAASIGVRVRPFMESALDLSCKLTERVPVRLLRFRESPDFWSAIDDDVRGDAHGVD